MNFDYHYISLFLKRWEIWIINLKLIKFSCILGKYNTLQQKWEEYGSLLKNINQTSKKKKRKKWYNCRDKKIKNTCRNILQKLTILEVNVTFYILLPIT